MPQQYYIPGLEPLTERDYHPDQNNRYPNIKSRIEYDHNDWNAISAIVHSNNTRYRIRRTPINSEIDTRFFNKDQFIPQRVEKQSNAEKKVPLEYDLNDRYRKDPFKEHAQVMSNRINNNSEINLYSDISDDEEEEEEEEVNLSTHSITSQDLYTNSIEDEITEEKNVDPIVQKKENSSTEEDEYDSDSSLEEYPKEVGVWMGDDLNDDSNKYDTNSLLSPSSVNDEDMPYYVSTDDEVFVEDNYYHISNNN